MRALQGLLLTVGFAAHAAAAPRSFTDYMFQVRDDLRIDLTNFRPTAALTVADLKALATASDDYAAFLAALSDRAPHLFDNHVLMHGTGSIQAASRAAPRVILFGDGLFLAFAEHDGATQRVEVIALDTATGGYTFHEVTFAPTGVVAEDNPRACAACHGTPGRPIWEPYDFWPNAFGSAIGRMHSAEERNAYAALMNAPQRRGIYAYLKDHSTDYFGDRYLPSIEAFTQYALATSFLGTAAALHERLRQNEAFRPAFYAAVQRCSHKSDVPFQNFFPAETWASAEASYATLLTETAAERQRGKTYLQDTYHRRFPSPTVVYGIDHDRLKNEVMAIAEMRFVLENLGVPLSDMAIGSGMNRYFMSTPSNFGPDLLTALARVDREAMLQMGFTISGTGNWVTASCETLRTESLERLAGVTFPTAAEQPLRQAAPMAKCIRCHAQPVGNIPAIPFDDTMRLKALFTERPALRAAITQRIHATGVGQMPPGAPLTATEKASLDAALDMMK